MSKAPSSGNILQRYRFASAAAGLAVIFAGAYFFRGGALTSAQAECDTLEAEGKKTERNVRNAKDLEKHIAAMQRGVTQLESKLARVDDVSGSQEYFYGLEGASGVRVTVLRPLGLPKGNAAATYQPVGFNVVVEGEYGQLIAFLRSLENGARLFRLQDFSVQRAAGGSSTDPAAKPRDVLTINLQLLAAK